MKLNMSKPIVAVLIPAFIGIISCADNPIKSASENAESGRSESAGNTGATQATVKVAKAEQAVTKAR